MGGENQMTKLYDETHYHFLYDQLVPNEGRADTLEGELLRAISRIHYDYLNNGFGNNWSGAWRFIDRYHGTTENERRLIRPYARGKCRRNAAYDETDLVLQTLELMTAKIMQFIDNGNGATTRSPADMFEFQERDLWAPR
jgi:hypothetical protein